MAIIKKKETEGAKKHGTERRRFTLSTARAGIIAEKIMRAYNDKTKVFRKPDLFPEEKLPRGMRKGSVEHARYLFLMNQLDHNVSSKFLYKYGRALCEARPEIFGPGHAFSDAELDEVVRTWLHYPFVEKSVRDIRHNFREIDARYGGNPINIFNEMHNVSEALLRLEEFEGSGANLSRLLLSYYIRAGMVRFENGIDFLPKIDIHDIQISISTGVVKFKGRVGKDDIIPVLSQFWSRFCKSRGYCVIEFDRALWAIGSGVCNKKDHRTCVCDCPVETECGSMPPTYYNDGFINPHVDDRPPQLALKLRYHEENELPGAHK